MSLGLPDLSFVDLTQIVQHTMAIRNVTDLPLVVDADTGFGNAVNVAHTVRMLERAGASAVQIEDQKMPKRCGHFAGKELVAPQEMAAKVKAAVDARRSDELLIIARTDARATEGFQAALDRAALYVEAGADVIFIEAPESEEEVRRIPASLPVPQLVNLVVGGRTRSSARQNWRRSDSPWCFTRMWRCRGPSWACRTRSARLSGSAVWMRTVQSWRASRSGSGLSGRATMTNSSVATPRRNSATDNQE